MPEERKYIITSGSKKNKLIFSPVKIFVMLKKNIDDVVSLVKKNISIEVTIDIRDLIFIFGIMLMLYFEFIPM